MTHRYLALDLGAESGRLMLGSLEDGRLSLQEMHRFANVPLRTGGSIHWNLPNLILEVKEGLRKAAAKSPFYASLSTDSWGVDYVLFDQEGAMMPPVFHYRDARTRRGVEAALTKVDRKTIYEQTGIQYMPINTVFQLMAEEPGRLASAQFLLGVGDAVNYFLSGVPRIEVSMASTFQLYNPIQKSWAESLLNTLGLPRSTFPEIVPSGSRLGSLRPELAKELGLAPLKVIASCSHDTGAAVVGVPASGKNWAYLSSGTWSLMGVELDTPVINDAARELNFTNEIGFGHSVRFLKNISGLWLIQECRREWAAAGKSLDYAELTELAKNAEPFRSLINPGSEEFLAPGSMPAQIADFCRRTKQPAPESPGPMVRCVLESLALLYRRTFRQIESLTGRTIRNLHIVGGGSNNDLLNQFTANALEIPVQAGPAEATATGNVLIQALALGHIPSLESARAIVRNSSVVRSFEPREQGQWRDAFARFETLNV